ncbi:hypothetical protein BTA51_08060 [Hahella sp. CCB-MM4]|uniref:WapI family immunity protein n=1 Tax=Hahella sp. (strain CCB-MM4) TaxID=1926491 RepID=UPI000B9BF45C|nr:hypothetical protein [Hahella sp. CCB-MM4]OZG73756.1 hypothetical protein BTA51_08060 [Hahella sp. CCB-MM4]
MRFRNSKGHQLELTILSWEFPNEDWLMIGILGTDDEGSWEGKDPSLTFSEAKELSSWLVSPGNFEDSSIEFMEPELEFRYKHGELRIYLEWNLRPPWRPSDNDDDEGYYLAFAASIEELKKQSKNLDEMLEKVSDMRN